MRDQYAGDISDLVKYSLLRSLAASDKSLGVAWYYNPDDARPDGHHREFWSEEKWLKLDAGVWRSLRTLAKPSVAAVEKLPIWPEGVQFHRVQVPIWSQRQEWAKAMTRSLDRCDLVFVDPDNGIGTGKRHATSDEIGSLRSPGKRTLVLIKFPSRVLQDKQEHDYHTQLIRETGTKNVLTLRTSISVPAGNGKRKIPRARWFTLLDYDSGLEKRLREFGNRLASIPDAKAMVRAGSRSHANQKGKVR